LMLVAKGRQDVVNRLFVKDSSPVWITRSSPQWAAQFIDDAQESIFRQWDALRAYVDRNTVRIVFHVILLGTLMAGFYWVRRRQPLKQTSGSSEFIILSHAPFSAAFVLSFIFLRWIYPEAPRLWWAILGTTAIVPSVTIARTLVPKDLRAVLYTILLSYFIDQVRTVMAAVELLPRVLFQAEMLGVVGFSAWLVRSLTIVQAAERNHDARHGVKAISYIAIVAFGLAFIADAFGYVTLGNLLGNALLTSAYFGVILYALVQVIYELCSLALTRRPLLLLTVVRRNGDLLRRRVHRGLSWLAVLLWFLVLLQRLLLRERLVMSLRSALTAELALGSLRVSLGDVLAFTLTVWASFLVSRLVRFVLSEDFFPRVHLARGLPYAISTTLHYLILLVGFFTAVAALGVDMTRVTILAGAFSVGVGFGLQNIFNNFVSGLILLFERPVSIGDLIQIDDNVGLVERIGIRASIIRTASGSEVIVPNGKLISERLINWRLTNRHHSVELSIAVAPDTDPKRVIALLERIAASHHSVIADPPPRAAVVKLTPDSIALELHAWTDRREEALQIRSDLAIAVSEAFTQEKIAIR
jgi:potassium-dependent mechanosensitive channel